MGIYLQKIDKMRKNARGWEKIRENFEKHMVGGIWVKIGGKLGNFL